MVQFAQGVDVSARLGYGIALFDSDISAEIRKEHTGEDLDESWFDMIEVLYEIAFNDEDFEKFAAEKNCVIQEYKEEDQRQIWIVSRPCWFETESHLEPVDFDFEINKNTIDASIQIVLKKLIEQAESICNCSISVYDYKPCWMLDLYYD